jgi:hypothetical protein
VVGSRNVTVSAVLGGEHSDNWAVGRTGNLAAAR